MTASFEIRESFDGKYVLFFLIDGLIDNSVYGTHGTGCKVYDTLARAIKAGKCYLRRMKSNGFDIWEV